MAEQYFQHEGQCDWNRKRLNKLVSILGAGWFPNKRILEVGCGHGQIGMELAERYGSDVTFTDGRSLHIDRIREKGFPAFVMDQDLPWTIGGQFDLIIHFGVLYHLDNWKQDIRCALTYAPLVCLETEIWGTDYPHFEHKKYETDTYDQAVNRIGTVMSAQCFEDVLTGLGANFTRYDDEDLDSGTMRYSWKGKQTPEFTTGQRRFWMIRKDIV